MASEKLAQTLGVSGSITPCFFPIRMVEDKQHFVGAAEALQKLRENRRLGPQRVISKFRERALGGTRRKIVYADVECRLLIRNGPFDRDGRVAVTAHETQERSRTNIVVVG